MAIKGLHSSQEFAVVSTIDENLCVLSHRLSENGERSSLKLFFFLLF